MKALAFFAISLAAAQAQSPAPAPPNPAAGAANVAPAIPNLPEDTVIATFDDGVDITFGEFRRIFYVMPAENQQMALRDRGRFLKEYGLFRKLTKMALEKKLDQKHPNDDALEYYRMFVLSQAMVNDMVNNIEVKPDEVTKYYEEHKSDYKQARVKAIYIAFSASPTPVNGKNPLTEAQAKAKAEKLVAQIRGGADFVQMVKQNSEDESRSRDGDFATLRPSDNIPDAIKEAVFTLQKGEITEPIRQPNGFYIFRAEDAAPRPLDQVRDEIFNTVRQKAYAEWFERVNKENQIVYHSPEFLGLTPLVTTPKQ
jgi:parvulin-like peptidyl-prolyl isomerase